MPKLNSDKKVFHNGHNIHNIIKESLLALKKYYIRNPREHICASGISCLE